MLPRSLYATVLLSDEVREKVYVSAVGCLMTGGLG